MKTTPFTRERRHTLYFLNDLRSFAPVFLGTEVDMSRTLAHRAAAGGDAPSIVAYVLHASARVLAAHPDANAAIRGRVRPRVARYPGVAGKLTFDKTINGRRVVVSAVFPRLHESSLADIQRQIDHFRAGDPARMREYAAVRLLHRLPWPLGPAMYRLGTRSLARRAERHGTFAVSSLGHRAVQSFFSVGGTTVTVGLGRIVDRPVARDGQVVIAPVLPLSLTFDHRVIDGAEAADVLSEIKARLEDFGTVGDAYPDVLVRDAVKR